MPATESSAGFVPATVAGAAPSTAARHPMVPTGMRRRVRIQPEQPVENATPVIVAEISARFSTGTCPAAGGGARLADAAGAQDAPGFRPGAATTRSKRLIRAVRPASICFERRAYYQSFARKVSDRTWRK